MRALSGIAATLVGSLLMVATAQGREPTKAEKDEAQRRFQEATELYEQDNNLAGALAEFRRAYAVAPNFRVLYNIGQLCYLLQDYPCALTSFSRYLREGGVEVPTARREEVQRDVNRLQARVAKVRVIVNRPGAEVLIDNVRVGRTPLESPVLVGVGRPQIRVTLNGYLPVTRVIEVASMESATVEIDLVPSDSPVAGGSSAGDVGMSAAQPRARASAPTPKLPWVITGVLALGAGTTGALALWSASDLKDRRNQFPVTSASELSDKSNRTKRLALVSDVLLGATVVSAAVATYLTFTAEPSRSNEVALSIGPRSIGLSGGF